MVLAEAVEYRTIAQLPEIVNSLSGCDRELFGGDNKIIEVSSSTSEIDLEGVLLDNLPPDRQPLTETYNPWDHRRSVFNPERANRLKKAGNLAEIEAEIAKTDGLDYFCRYPTQTPKNKFGRIEGRFCVTAGNLYPSAEIHGLIILEHNPLTPPTLDRLIDRFDVSDQWFDIARDLSPDAIYQSMIENRLRKAGSTVLHGHAQVASRSNRHEGQMEEYLDIAHWYHYKTGRDYFDDLFHAHQVVGLGVEIGSMRIFPSLTPAKEAEIDIFADRFDYPTRRLVYRVYNYFMNILGAKAFNFTTVYRPNSYDGRDWLKVPGVIMKFINRGDPTAGNSDIAGFELMGTSIIETDPYTVNDGLRKVLTV